MSITSSFVRLVAATTALLALVLLLSTVSAPAAHAASGCENAGAQPSQLTSTQMRKSIQCLINRERKSRGLRSLRDNAKLRRAALGHTKDMRRRQYFAHQRSGGPSMVARIKRTRYLRGASSWAVAENIAYGSGALGTPRSIVRAWMNSAGHRHNILNPQLRDAGVGVARGLPVATSAAVKRNGLIATQDFGFRH